MAFLTVEHLLRMGLELTLGVCLKLFCDNGRLHWRDFANDFFFWLPGFRRLPADGLSRQVTAMVPAAPDAAQPLPLAAK